MKQFFLLFALVIGVALDTNGQEWYSNTGNNSNRSSYSTTTNASLTIQNRSSYSLTVKIMKTNERGLYQTVYISPQSSRTVYFSKSDSFYTKTKASKNYETLYKKSGIFSIQCDKSGYSQATIEFFVSSGGGGTGQGISKAEFERDK
jgi:hypothetical protein